jgi:hypothetical protein
MIMKINIFYFIWILIKIKSIIKPMRFIFDKYNIDTFEIKLLWKIIKFTKEKEIMNYKTLINFFKKCIKDILISFIIIYKK